MVLNIIGWVVFGLIAGLIARAIVPGKDDIGLFMTIVLGIVGSIAGGVLFDLIKGHGFHGFQDFRPAGFIGSVIGAIIVLVIYNKVTGRKRLRR
ncbi:GlsB/YeaQ/YmgE family stress response membrane protein [Saccharopolyspora rosea]|uniref:GlsB/YeaQ/YmgE family stress response membrane protein n=1 Tax=Saccharopolyspora rosea TaxID=524884 RepID=A0ABW3FUV4_9PSEU|nr:GlsB/YeaQ/YmgE family stress response membrane protein [Saccharopolyspora rosea]